MRYGNCFQTDRGWRLLSKRKNWSGKAGYSIHQAIYLLSGVTLRDYIKISLENFLHIAMAGTLTPTPFQTVLDDTGVASPGALIYTYTAGTTTAAATYTTAALSVPNANPIVADSAGRYVAYLAAGANMKFVYKTSAGATIRTQDNVLSVPGAAVNLDIQGTVGVAVAAGEVCYLSSGAESPALTPGLWYLADADFAVSSTTCQSIGMAVSAIAINTAGTIRIAGLATTASAVVVGSTYYVSATAGGITTSAPALSRVVGVADTTSTLILAATSAVAATLPNPIAQDLLFVDATYDIGKSGASRPRDLFQSRNATIGGTLGVTGAATLASAVAVTGARDTGLDAGGDGCHDADWRVEYASHGPEWRHWCRVPYVCECHYWCRDWDCDVCRSFHERKCPHVKRLCVDIGRPRRQ
jgi:hypothetical protein